MSGFAGLNDLAEKIVSFDELGPALYGYDPGIHGSPAT